MIPSRFKVPEGVEVRFAPLNYKVVARATEGQNDAPDGSDSAANPVADSGGSVVIEGFAAVYNSMTDLGLFKEIIAPGAFAASLGDPASDVVFCFNHDFNNLLGRQSAGTATFEERPEGLFSSVRLAGSGLGPWVAEAVGRGDLRGQSFLGYVEGESWDETGPVPVRTITRVRLIEAGVVTMPAYTDTTIGVQRMAEHRSRQISGNDFSRRRRAECRARHASHSFG